MDFMDEEKSSKRNHNLLIRYSRREEDVDKARGPGNNGYLERKTGSADKLHDEASVKQSTKIHNSASKRTVEEEQEVCLAPTSTSVPHAGFEVKVSKDSIPDSREELLSEKIIKKCHGSLKAEVAELRQEISKLRCKMERRATKCMRLTDENRDLMDELRELCDPHLIDALEAMNPDKSLQPQRDR